MTYNIGLFLTYLFDFFVDVFLHALLQLVPNLHNFFDIIIYLADDICILMPILMQLRRQNRVILMCVLALFD